MTNKLKVGIYLRLSDEDRDKTNKTDDSESIKNQRNMLLEVINKNDNYILVDEYCDENLSGAGTYRKEFERLIRDCKNHKLDIVLCKSQSRFSRDMEIVEKYINNLFKEWNIRFISLSDNADTENPGNKKSRQINGLVNEWYLEDVSHNIRSAFNTKMKQGEFISPFAPYGYLIDPKNNNKLVIDPIASLIVKKIYNLYLDGYGYLSITKYLNNHNIPSPSLYKYQKGIKLNIISKKEREQIKWNTTSIKTILTNEIYIGNLIQGKRTTISYKNHKIIKKDKSNWIYSYNTQPKIIDEYSFNKVKLSIKKRTKETKTTGKSHIFSSKIYCQECNHTMKKKSTSKHNYLVCPNIYNDCPNKHSIRYDLLENIILEKINNLINQYLDPTLLNKYINKYKNTENNINILNIKKKELIKNINKTNLYIKSLYEDKVNNIISIKDFKKLLSTYNFNIDTYTKELKSTNILLNKKKTNKNYNYNSYKIDKLNNYIVDEFIDKIYISNIENNTRNISIYFKV